MKITGHVLCAAFLLAVGLQSTSAGGGFERISDRFELKRSSRTMKLYVVEGKKRRQIAKTMGETETFTGWDLKRRIYAVSDDGQQLLYLQLDGKDSDGLYLYTYGEGNQRLAGGVNLAWGTKWPKPLPDSIVVYLSTSQDGLPRFGTTEGEDLPLALLGGTELHAAAYGGKADDVDRLIADGAGKDELTYWGFTALEVATIRGHEHIAVRLIESGADIDAGEGEPLVALATCFGRIKVLETLHGKGVDLNSETLGGGKPIYIALNPNRYQIGTDNIFGGSLTTRVPDEAILQLVRWLLEHGADPNARTGSGRTPLHRATDDAALTGLLLQHGADPDARDDDGNIPLHFAAGKPAAGIGNEWDLDHWERTHRPTLELLVPRTTDIDARNGEGLTPLQVKVHAWQWRTAEYLIEHGADETVSAVNDRTAQFKPGCTVRQRIDQIVASRR